MAEPEGFLDRWSRLKREARAEPAQPPLPPGEEPAETGTGAKSETVAGAAPAAAPFDPDSLPPVDSLGADSDYTRFLSAEVPPALRRLALRRAWVSDPKIAGFRGFAEYDWDCNAPGYGRLLPTDDIRGMIEAVFREEPKPAPAESPEAPEAAAVAAAEAPAAPAPPDPRPEGEEGGAVAQAAGPDGDPDRG